MNAHSSRRVSARLVFTAYEQAEMILQVAVASMAGLRAEEDLAIRRDGEPVKATEVAMPHGGRTHLLALDPGRPWQQQADRRRGRNAPAQAGCMPGLRAPGGGAAAGA